MEVKNIRWIGVHTQQYDEMVGFLGDVMGLHFRAPDGHLTSGHPAGRLKKLSVGECMFES
jgi:hypothetical protein